MHTIVNGQLAYIVFLMVHCYLWWRLFNLWLYFFGALWLECCIRAHSVGHFRQRLLRRLLICWGQDGIRLDLLLIHRHTIGVSHVRTQFSHNFLRILCRLPVQNGSNMLLLLTSSLSSCNLGSIFAIKCWSSRHIMFLYRSTILQIFVL